MSAMRMTRSAAVKNVNLALIIILLLTACSVSPRTGAQTNRGVTAGTPPTPIVAGSDVATATAAGPTPTLRVIHVTRTSGAATSSSQVTVSVVTPTPTPTSTPLPTLTAAPVISETLAGDAELASMPTILQGLAGRKPCGFADIVAFDGHALRAEPVLPWPTGNTVEELAEGTRVSLIDCRLWTDADDLTWVAVQTEVGKLGWILIQPDAVYVTILPIAHEVVPPALTGIPAGTKRAYVPPSECPDGDRSTEGTATSIGIDLIPIVGDVKGLGEAATGCDLVTGEPLGDWRWFGLLGVVGLSEVALLRHGDDVADVARFAGKGDEVAGLVGRNADEVAGVAARNADEVAGVAGRNADEAAGAAGRNADETGSAVGRNADTAADVAKTAGKIDGLTDEGIDAAKLIENGSSSVDEAALLAAKFEQPCSFSAHTPVVTDDGPVPISMVQPGDRVLAYHEELATTGFFTVTNRFAHLDPVIVEIRAGGDLVQTTPEHPFYVDDRWVPAQDLQVGDRLASSSGGSALVERVATVRRPEVMWNLTVTEAHTYFVGDGAWLVHNACSRVLRKNLARDPNVKTWDCVDQGDTCTKTAWQAHHIVPGQYEDRPVVQAAIDGGWKIDGTTNGIALPYLDEVAEAYHLPSHRGFHKAYSDSVERELSILSQAWSREKWTSQRSAQEVEKLVARLRAEIGRMPSGQQLKSVN